METTWIWSHLLKKSLMENFIFCAVLQASQLRTSTNFILRCNIPENIYLFKINNRNTRKSHETKKTEHLLKSLW